MEQPLDLSKTSKYIDETKQQLITGTNQLNDDKLCENNYLSNIEEKITGLINTENLCTNRRSNSLVQKNVRKTSGGKSLLPCDVCNKTFDRPSLLKRHIRTHTGEKPHICEICNKGFSTSSSLNTHRRIHTGLKPHICGFCGKRFTASSNLYYHRMTHTKIKPHKCNLCTRSFPTPGDLRSHMYVHSGSWPFRCNICSRGFSKQTNLRNHIAMHNGNRPFVCKLCKKKFALQCNLKSHIKIYHSTTNNVVDSEEITINATKNQKDQPLLSTIPTKNLNIFNLTSFNFLPDYYKNWLLSDLHRNFLITSPKPY